MNVSMLANAMATEPKAVDAGAVVLAIRNGEYQKPVTAIRKLYARELEKSGDHKKAKRAVEALKKRLPAVQFCGTFEGRGDKAITEHSGLLVADVDHLDPATQAAARAKLASDPHVYAFFQSPTGTGLKVVFAVRPEAANHAGNFLAVKNRVAEVCGLAVDESGSNTERLCFVSDDPEAFCNDHALPLQPVETPEPKRSKLRSDTCFANGASRQHIAEKLLGAIRWETETEGFCQCPGTHLHNTGDGERDCVVWTNGAPTVKCFHESCRGIIEAVNHQLRSEIGKAEYSSGNNGVTNGDPVLTPDTAENEFEFATLLAKQLPPIKTVEKTWHVFERGTWAPVESAIFKPQALAIQPQHKRTVRTANTLLDHVEAANQVDPNIFKGFHTYDKDGAVLVNCANGVVRVSANDLELLPHAAHYQFTRQAVASFNREATAPLFVRVLMQVLPDPEDWDLFKLFLGYTLLPDCRYEAALCCYGEAGRGKSTVADPPANVLGPGLVSRLSMSQVCDPRSYHLPALRYGAVNLGTELTTADISESGNFKTIVSGEPIEARPIYGKPFVMQTACKLWFLSNSLPRFKYGTEAELRRTRFLRFDYQPPKKDVTLKSRLAAELDGVFAFMLEGLRELLSLPEIPLGGRESRAVHERFRISNDPVGAFVQSRCHLDPEARVSKDTLREAYAEFTARHELSTDCREWFFRVLFERFTNLREIQPRVAGERVRHVQGLQLLPNVTIENE